MPFRACVHAYVCATQHHVPLTGKNLQTAEKNSPSCTHTLLLDERRADSSSNEHARPRPRCEGISCRIVSAVCHALSFSCGVLWRCLCAYNHTPSARGSSKHAWNDTGNSLLVVVCLCRHQQPLASIGHRKDRSAPAIDSSNLKEN